MAKCYMIVVHTTPTPKQTKLAPSTDWKQCVLCQDDMGQLCSPTNFKSLTTLIGSGYKSLQINSLSFKNLVICQITWQCENWWSHGMAATLMAHNASWHKTCHLKFNKTELERLQGQSSAEVMAHISSAVTISSSSKFDLTHRGHLFSLWYKVGFACFHEYSTYDTDMKIHPEMCDGTWWHCPAVQAYTSGFDCSEG